VSSAPRVTFRNPLVRSAIYRLRSSAERREVLSTRGSDRPQINPDSAGLEPRAGRAGGPTSQVHSELESSAGRAQARRRPGGGAAAYSSALLRSTTPRFKRTGARAVHAAGKRQAGAFDAAMRLLDTAEAAPLEGAGSGRK